MPVDSCVAWDQCKNQQQCIAIVFRKRNLSPSAKRQTPGFNCLINLLLSRVISCVTPAGDLFVSLVILIQPDNLASGQTFCVGTYLEGKNFRCLKKLGVEGGVQSVGTKRLGRGGRRGLL